MEPTPETTGRGSNSGIPILRLFLLSILAAIVLGLLLGNMDADEDDDAPPTAVKTD